MRACLAILLLVVPSLCWAGPTSAFRFQGVNRNQQGVAVTLLPGAMSIEAGGTFTLTGAEFSLSPGAATAEAGGDVALTGATITTGAGTATATAPTVFTFEDGTLQGWATSGFIVAPSYGHTGSKSAYSGIVNSQTASLSKTITTGAGDVTLYWYTQSPGSMSLAIDGSTVATAPLGGWGLATIAVSAGSHTFVFSASAGGTSTYTYPYIDDITIP